jgi:hypothetical protein
LRPTRHESLQQHARPHGEDEQDRAARAKGERGHGWTRAIADHTPANAEDERAQNEVPVDRSCAGLLELRGSKRPPEIARPIPNNRGPPGECSVRLSGGWQCWRYLGDFMIIAIKRSELLVPSFPFN